MEPLKKPYIPKFQEEVSKLKTQKEVEEYVDNFLTEAGEEEMTIRAAKKEGRLIHRTIDAGAIATDNKKLSFKQIIEKLNTDNKDTHDSGNVSLKTLLENISEQKEITSYGLSGSIRGYFKSSGRIKLQIPMHSEEINAKYHILTDFLKENKYKELEEKIKCNVSRISYYDSKDLWSRRKLKGPQATKVHNIPKDIDNIKFLKKKHIFINCYQKGHHYMTK